MSHLLHTLVQGGWAPKVLGIPGLRGSSRLRLQAVLLMALPFWGVEGSPISTAPLDSAQEGTLCGDS